MCGITEPVIDEDKQQEIFLKSLRNVAMPVLISWDCGLAISKGVLLMYYQQISMRSWPGEGSVFSITLARAEQVAPVVQARRLMAMCLLIEHLKILCV